MKKLLITVLILTGIFFVSLSACSKASPNPASTTASPGGSLTPATALSATPSIVNTSTPFSISDPFAYCAAVGTINHPDSNYTGPRMPASVVKGLITAFGAPADSPVEVFASGSLWRCMDGKVYACYVGANLPCSSKANTSSDPSTAEASYCTANPADGFIPASVTGHDTIFSWSCKDGKAVAGKQVFQVDKQGFVADIWYPIAQPK